MAIPNSRSSIVAVAIVIAKWRRGGGGKAPLLANFFS